MVQMIGFNLRKISINREENIDKKIEVKYNISIKDVKKIKFDIVNSKETFSFNFLFTINYEPKLAKIEFEGNILVLVEPKEAKDILKSWKKKKIPDTIRLLVFNVILVKCSIKALELEDDLNLPYHVPVPKLAPEQQPQRSYTG
jgi:hypothetical protein